MKSVGVDLTRVIRNARHVSFGYRTPMRVLWAYASLFDQRGTKGFVAAGFVSRLTSSMVFVSLILVTALVSGIGPLAGLAAVLTCALGGTLALAAQRSTEPEPAGRAAGARDAGNSLRIPALQALYAARFCAGVVFGAMPVSLI